MKLFQPLYEWTLQWARHRQAQWILAGMSFIEAIFFPVPPDALLLPMCLARPERAYRYAALTTLATVAGGVVGFLLGQWALDWVWPWVESLGWAPAFEQSMALFRQWGFWVIFIAGFTPIPYKVFTLSAGAAGVGWLSFLLGSVVGRGARFFLEAALVHWLGPRAEPVIHRHVEALGWAMVAILAGLLLWHGLSG